MTRTPNTLLKRFLVREDGVMTVFGLFLFLLVLVVGGLAVDVANATRNRTMLQIAADSVAHAALIVRESGTEAEAIEAALALAAQVLPPSFHGDAILPEDIVFGRWDADSRTFTAQPGSYWAVQVDAERAAERLNPVATFLLSFIGVNSWDINTRAVFEAYYPTCMLEGLVGEEEVDLTSNNYFSSGYCVHSNDYMEANNGNVFGTDAVVSMPDSTQVSLPSSGWDSNPGMEDAVRDGAYRLRIVDRIEEIIVGVQTPGSPHYRDYIVTSTPVVLSRSGGIDVDDWQPGRIHVVNCATAHQQLNIAAGTILTEGVLVTNCKIHFGEGVGLEDVVIASTNPLQDAINTAASMRLGVDDDCAPGGGAQILTTGGFSTPAQFEVYGSQVIARLDIQFASQSAGLYGASLISGQRVYGTANATFGFCGGGMENSFQSLYFRMVQ